MSSLASPTIDSKNPSSEGPLFDTPAVDVGDVHIFSKDWTPNLFNSNALSYVSP